MKYPLAERFKSIQGEGLYTGTPMAFIRLVGCSVGQRVCTACDTDFDRMQVHLGGGSLTPEEIKAWAKPYSHLCITGGEPLDRDLRPLFETFFENVPFEKWMVHIETSGTKHPEWLFSSLRGGDPYWICVSPKPGYLESMIQVADEIKVIIGGLGDGPGWPTLDQASTWASYGKLVYVQPRNHKHTVDDHNMQDLVEEITKNHPELRLSTQFHKYLHVR